MWSLKNFKMSEILCVITFKIYLISISLKIVYIGQCIYPAIKNGTSETCNINKIYSWDYYF
jgi:hypothetical protein